MYVLLLLSVVASAYVCNYLIQFFCRAGEKCRACQVFCDVHLVSMIQLL